MDAQPLTPFFALERAHCVLARLPALGRPPRSIVAKLLPYRVRDLLLQRAHKVGPFEIGGRWATLFPYFTAAVQGRRATFTAMKRVLRKEGIGYSLIFPSQLKIMLEGCIHLCQEPDEAWAWLETYRAGTDGAQNEEPKPPRCRGKRRHPRDPTENTIDETHTAANMPGKEGSPAGICFSGRGGPLRKRAWVRVGPLDCRRVY
ncbi:hypothetical protein NDU88_001827 [Pleurodeles waltl]|uniref:Uncharacterized protein n=1 Tax=Pleurodeles waltl TaxID=8319 RepID=A0AAV7Q4A0_PLEWA|nr:hypothetical protein NDU88_001827 [Pleurodeles waltl]